MTNLFERAKRFHTFWAAHGLYPLLLATLLAGGLLVTRMYLSRTLTYKFLMWNLFLAWIPYFMSMWAAYRHQRYPRRVWLLLIPGAIWLAFFPNAPYIITDFLHLKHRPPIPTWYDIGLLATFAWTGLFLAVYSLRSMQIVVQSLVGTVASWLFVLGVLGLSGLGVYMGRFLRWNSWDLVLRPQDVLYDIGSRLAHPLSNPGAVGVTILFSAFLLICYLTLTAITTPQKT